jgi:DNA-binding transcriptional LysR family regulator
VTASVDFSSRFLGAIVADVLHQNPDINIELEATDRIVDLIEEGFDLAVRFGQMPESTLIARRLCALELVLCASPQYLAARGTPSSVEELDEHDHVLFTPASRNQTWTLHGPGEGTYEFGRPARLASNNYGAVVDVARAGGGIALISEFMVTEEIKSGALVRVLPEWATKPSEVHAVYPARQNLPPRLTLFIDHLAKALNPPPWAR